MGAFKMIKADVLDEQMYADREKKIKMTGGKTPVLKEGEEVVEVTDFLSVREYLKMICDMPAMKSPITKPISRGLEACWTRLNEGGDFVVDEGDFGILNSHIENGIGLSHPVVYLNLINIMGKALPYVPPKVVESEVVH